MYETFRAVISNRDLLEAVADGYATAVAFVPVDGYPRLVDVSWSARPFADRGPGVFVMRTSRATARKLGLAA
jgi:hypothetical protein